MAKKIRTKDPELIQDYVFESEMIHKHQALMISQYYWHIPKTQKDENLKPKDKGEGHYKIGKKMLYCLECRAIYCLKCK